MGPSVQDAGHALVLGVLDGHGEQGSQVAALCAQQLQAALHHSVGTLDTDAKGALQDAFSATEARLMASARVDPDMSGATAAVVMVLRDRLVVANAGDCRCLLGRLESPQESPQEVVAYELTNAHTPALLPEANRVLASGGRIACMELGGLRVGPPRVWAPSTDSPGLSVTRAFGDSMAKRLGVVATPETLVLPLTAEDRYLVLASDGVTEHLDSQSIMDIVHDMASRGMRPDVVARAVISEARARWREQGLAVDDCTLAIAYLVYDPEGVLTRDAQHSFLRHARSRRRYASGSAGRYGLGCCAPLCNGLLWGGGDDSALWGAAPQPAKTRLYPPDVESGE